MRIDRLENVTSFKQLQFKTRYPYYLNDTKINYCKDKLKNTKFVDIVFDSQGFAIKDKMTELLHRFQSFSLFPKENAIGIRAKDQKEPVYKFIYQTLKEAEKEWEKYLENAPNDILEKYTSLALWIENNLKIQNRNLDS